MAEKLTRRDLHRLLHEAARFMDPDDSDILDSLMVARPYSPASVVRFLLRSLPKVYNRGYSMGWTSASDQRAEIFKSQSYRIEVLTRERAGLVRELADVNKKYGELLEIERSKSTRDDLTNLFNRKEFRRRLVQFYYAYPKPSISAVMIVDVNRFKPINDTFGHRMGDLVILRTAKILRQESSLKYRKNKRTSRYDLMVARLGGGDEFGIFLADLDSPEDAIQIAERYHSAFSSINWVGEYKHWREGLRDKFPDPSLYHNPALAIGLVVVDVAQQRSPSHARELAAKRVVEAILGLADKFMYKSKEEEKKTGIASTFMTVLQFQKNQLLSPRQPDESTRLLALADESN